MKKSAMQLLFSLVATILVSSFNWKSDRVNFSGEWKLNENKSELGTFDRRMVATILKVEQNADAIIITRTSPSFNGDENTTSSETLSFDGKEIESTGFGNSKKKSSAKWSADAQTLIISYTLLFERNGQTFEVKGVVTWSIKDGSLNVVTVSSSPRGETTTKAVYDK